VDLLIALMLFAAGIVGGVLSGLVGGASLVTFPALLAMGLPPVTAAASNLVANLPSNFTALLADRVQFPALDRSFVWLIVTSVAGALIGSSLLLLTPGRTFEILVPLLLGFATILFAFAGRVSRWLRSRAAAGAAAPVASATSVPMMLLVAIYGGYFGAGAGVVALAILSVATGGDYRAANVTKNVILGLNSVVASAVLVWQQAVSWPPALIMMAGAVIGGFCGGHLARVVPAPAMRVVVVSIGLLLTVVFALRYWL
jgi:uncharacterized membrane protein YfcA